MSHATTSPAPAVVPLAAVLLDRVSPPVPALADAIPAALRDDPRFLAGRLAQALSVLLADDLGPADPPTALLSQALADAIAWRQRGRDCTRCAASLCPQCATDWDQADRYHLLALMLGAAGAAPGTSPAGRP